MIASGLEQPHGVAFRAGALFVAERTRVLRYDDIEARLAVPPAPAPVLTGLPRYAHHGLRPLGVVTLREGRPVSYEPFAEGWLRGRRAWGRPVV